MDHLAAGRRYQITEVRLVVQELGSNAVDGDGNGESFDGSCIHTLRCIGLFEYFANKWSE